MATPKVGRLVNGELEYAPAGTPAGGEWMLVVGSDKKEVTKPDGTVLVFVSWAIMGNEIIPVFRRSRPRRTKPETEAV